MIEVRDHTVLKAGCERLDNCCFNVDSITAGADGFLVPKHQLQTCLTFRPYICGPSEHGMNMIAFPAILSNKTFSKNITSSPPKHRQFFVIFSSGEKTLIWGSKMSSCFVLLLFLPRNEVYFPSWNRQFLDGCSVPKNVLCFGGRTLLQVGRLLGQCFSWQEKYSPKGRHVWLSCFTPKNPSATAVHSGAFVRFSGLTWWPKLSEFWPDFLPQYLKICPNFWSDFQTNKYWLWMFLLIELQHDHNGSVIGVAHHHG